LAESWLINTRGAPAWQKHPVISSTPVMSTSRRADGHLNVASKTSFDALAVDIGEESEEEEVLEVVPLPETFVTCFLSVSALVLSSHVLQFLPA
jgi:hypothetical protein